MHLEEKNSLVSWRNKYKTCRTPQATRYPKPLLSSADQRRSLKRIEHPHNRGETQNKKFQEIYSGTFASGNDVCLTMVNLTTTQVETLFGELEYIEPRLKALGVIVADEEVDHV